MVEDKVGKGEFKIESKMSVSIEEDNPIRLFYKQYTTIIAQLFGLSKNQTLTLAEILFQNYRFKDIVTETKYRWSTVFDVDNRKVMQDNLQMGDRNFCNYLTALRKKGILRGIAIHNKFVVYPIDNQDKVVFDLRFMFDITKA